MLDKVRIMFWNQCVGCCLSLFLFTWVFICLPARAETASDPSSATTETRQSFIDREHLFGEWGGMRTWLRDHGVEYDLIYTAEGFMNTRGGLNTDDAREYRGDLSLYMQLDTEMAGWWRDGLFNLTLQEAHGKGITEDHVGDFQYVSNIDADDFKQVSEFWYQHSFLEDRLWIKLGKMEAGTDFACPLYGCDFLHSCPGLSPTVLLPTYPDQDWGVVIGTFPVEWFSMNIGVFQGRFDGGRSIGATLDDLHGPHIMIEPAYHYNIGSLPGLFRLGGWWNGDQFDRYDEDEEDPGTVGDNHGFYAIWDQFLWRENPGDDEDEQGLSLFAQLGWAPEDRNEAEHYIGGGVQWSGAIPTRDADVAGLGAFRVDFSDEAGYVDNSETAIELFYRIQTTGWMSLKPDLQYIINPGGSGEEDALVLGLRMEVSF